MQRPPLLTTGGVKYKSHKRVYIGGLPSPTYDFQIISFFNAVLVALRLVTNKANPVSACLVNTEKCFAFMEFLDPNDATAALALDGIMYNGNTLKVKRPRDFVRGPGVSTFCFIFKYCFYFFTLLY